MEVNVKACSKDTRGDLAVVCVFKADAAVPAVVFSSPEVTLRRVSQLAVGEGISPVGVFVADAVCRLIPAGRALCCSQPRGG